MFVNTFWGKDGGLNSVATFPPPRPLDAPLPRQTGVIFVHAEARASATLKIWLAELKRFKQNEYRSTTLVRRVKRTALYTYAIV